jgi:hypothetical protein
MKWLIYSAAFALTITAIIPSSPAIARGRPPEWWTQSDANAPYIIHSVAYPRDAKYKNATYHFGLQVTGMSISKLTVEIPDGIRLPRSIQVSDQAKRKIPVQVSSSDGNVMIAFAQPVPVNTTLEVDLNGIDASFYSPSTKLFHVSGTVPGLTRDIPFGFARFRSDR